MTPGSLWSNSSKLGASAFTPSRSLDSTNQTAASGSYAAFTRMRPLRIGSFYAKVDFQDTHIAYPLANRQTRFEARDCQWGNGLRSERENGARSLLSRCDERERSRHGVSPDSKRMRRRVPLALAKRSRVRVEGFTRPPEATWPADHVLAKKA
jgi:hypothetical protein